MEGVGSEEEREVEGELEAEGEDEVAAVDEGLQHAGCVEDRAHGARYVDGVPDGFHRRAPLQAVSREVDETGNSAGCGFRWSRRDAGAACLSVITSRTHPCKDHTAPVK
jgi:hypothetical protein